MTKPSKIIKIGNSVGVILPKEVLARLRLGLGGELFFSEDPKGYRITASDPEFIEAMSAAEDIMREDRDILAVLAK
ncbi:MAG: AbrB/MazE/SpoVT family DNA-binding domain-containing protein [Sphingomonadales bacterium]|nr:MAG: AbrB/MazE/SpoVT family DNA-binding domain-containing protein [Sphingomonadales bacterium]